MATRRPLVNVGGSISELPSGDSVAGAGGRTVLTESITLYVATTGNDTTGDGSVGNPWATPQFAINYIGGQLDIGPYTVTIQLADGTYDGVVVAAPWLGTGSVILQGNETTPANVVLAATGNAVDVTNGGKLSVRWLKATAGASNYCFVAQINGSLTITGPVIAGAGGYKFAGNAGGVTYISANVTIDAGGTTAIFCGGLGGVRTFFRTFTITGTPAFTQFAQFAECGVAAIPGCTFTGSATGKRYTGTLNGVCRVGGAGETYLPGNTAGTLATGAQYA